VRRLLDSTGNPVLARVVALDSLSSPGSPDPSKGPAAIRASLPRRPAYKLAPLPLSLRGPDRENPCRPSRNEPRRPARPRPVASIGLVPRAPARYPPSGTPRGRRGNRAALNQPHEGCTPPRRAPISSIDAESRFPWGANLARAAAAPSGPAAGAGAAGRPSTRRFSQVGRPRPAGIAG